VEEKYNCIVLIKLQYIPEFYILAVYSCIKMDSKHVIVNMKNKLCFEEQHIIFKERNFLICRSCFWCASYVNKMRSVLEACPSCKDVKIESVPISFDETYRLDYDKKRGVTLEFARTR
jgi:hypothetical protein